MKFLLNVSEPIEMILTNVFFPATVLGQGTYALIEALMGRAQAFKTTDIKLLFACWRVSPAFRIFYWVELYSLVRKSRR